MTDSSLNDTLEPHGLSVMGVAGDKVLVGASSQMWPIFTQSAEFKDGQKDPLDRWSKRILGSIAASRGWNTAYPSDGPPYAPFIAWALATGRFWQSPSGMLVHDVAGLMVSIRGALLTDCQYTDSTSLTPCITCENSPCATTCPVDALSAERGYDVPACHAYLNTAPGRDCLENGCKARRACPVSSRFGRDPEQSAFHMKAFHPT